MKSILAKKATLMFLSGTMGSGKTACLTKYLVDYFLSENTGRIITNVSLLPEKIADRVCKRFKRMKRSDVLRRIVVIPEDWRVKLLEGEASIKEFFDWFIAKECDERDIPNDPDQWEDYGYEHPLSAGLLALDEAQKMIPAGHGDGKGQNQSFLEYVSTIRHLGGRCILISQDFENVASKVRRLVAARAHVRNCVHWTFPIIGLPMDVILQMWAKVIGDYSPWCDVEEYSGNPDRGEQLELKRKHWLPSEIFGCYRSRDNEGSVDGREEELEYKRLSTLGFLRWVFVVHWFSWFRVFGIIGLVLYFIYPGMMLGYYGKKIWKNVSARLSASTTFFNDKGQGGEKRKVAGDVPPPAPVADDSIEPVEEEYVLEDGVFLKIIEKKGVIFSNGHRVMIGQEYKDLGVLKDVDIFYGEARFTNRDMRLSSAWLSSNTGPRNPGNRVSGSVPTAAGRTVPRDPQDRRPEIPPR